MNCDCRISYDEGEDRILGPHSNVQVVMVRENSGYQVVATVSDLGGKNCSVWNDLKVSYDKSFFQNPFDSIRKVWVFADVPYLYKLIRNHFLDKGFIVGVKKISKEVIEKILMLDSNEAKICPRLSLHHISVKGRERQRVYLETQLFSNQTAKAIRYLLPDEMDTADFFQLMNDSFDILNARNFKDDRLLARGYRYDLKNQKIIIDKLKSCIENLVISKTFKKTKKVTLVKRKEKIFFPFQKGFLMTIASLYGLYEDLMPLDVKFILTSRLNQDCLENFFSKIRGVGHFYDHPLPSEVRHRIRLLLLGKNVDDIPFSSATNTLPCEDKSLLTTELLEHMSPDLNECGNQSEIRRNNHK
ncbi:unnamed protein product [Larinioides sclopetarius]|uniref:Transposable element P transposase-like GTP-binding insertion domain-containing protein n=1 Tax=Larinioides sclopetarius TaxID=280406 RepID=A0AAV2B0M0_9ARAC